MARGEWVALLSALSVVTMTLGNVLALVQHNIKRMLAYSSIAQAGYVLIGVVAVIQSPGHAVSARRRCLFYLGVYVLTNIAAFAVVIAVTNALGTEEISGLAGLSRRSLGLALAMLAAMLSPGRRAAAGRVLCQAVCLCGGDGAAADVARRHRRAEQHPRVVLLSDGHQVRLCGSQRRRRAADAGGAGAQLWMWVAVAGILILGVFATPWYTLAAKAAAGFYRARCSR